MKYINANVILPDELVEELQKYVQAGYIYVPARKSSTRPGANCPVIGRNLRNATERLYQNTARAILWKSWLTGTAFQLLLSERLFIKRNRRRAKKAVGKTKIAANNHER